MSKAELTKQSTRVAPTRLFRDKGPTATGVREIAAAVGVDPALANHHFGSKEALFLETMTEAPVWEAILASPLDDLGNRVPLQPSSRVSVLSSCTYRCDFFAPDRFPVAWA